MKIFQILEHPKLRELLDDLYSRNHLSFREIRKILKKEGRGKICYWLDLLKDEYLITKNDHNGLYNLTVRGLTVRKSMNEIENSELFISRL